MARQEHDREDLLAEATALVERVEISDSQRPHPVVLGVRRDGCFSAYCTPDFAVHLNTRHEIRRLYVHGRLLKAENGQLIELTRHRADGQVQLIRREVSRGEQDALLLLFARYMISLEMGLKNDHPTLRAVPSDLPAHQRIRTWLDALPSLLVVADSPHAR